MVIRDQKTGQRNAEKMLLLDVVSWKTFEIFSKLTKETGKNNSNRKKITNYMSNTKERYHFLPPYLDIPGCFIDFQSVKSIKIESLSNYTKVATISTFFLKDITARFGRYYSRQGQPDLNIDNILKDMLPEK